MDHEPSVIEREVHHVEKSGGAFAGFLFAVILVIAVVVGYFVISDDDADGQIDTDVPSVDVDVQE